VAGRVENLTPHQFKPGEDARRGRRGQPSPLNDPEIVDLFAKGVTDGLTTEQLANEFAVTDRTIRNWKNDPRVKAAAYKYINERIVRITAKTDAKLDALLRSERFNDLPLEEQVALLLKVRKEYLGGVLRLQAEGGKPDAETINEAMNELEDNPEFATELRELLERQPEKA
jgi:transposase